MLSGGHLQIAALPLFSQIAPCPHGDPEQGSKTQFVYGSPLYPDLHLQIADLKYQKLDFIQTSYFLPFKTKKVIF